jgi:hypothetical protein
MKITKSIISLIFISATFFSCSNGGNKLEGRWSLIKRISPQGNIVDESSPFNFYENYVMEFNSDGKALLVEFDSKGFGHGRNTHKVKHGDWKIEKSDEQDYPYLLTLRLNMDDGVEERSNKVRTLSGTELIYVAPDNFTWYFEKK